MTTEVSPRSALRAQQPVPSFVIIMMLLVGIGLAWLVYAMVGAEIAFERKAQFAEGQVIALKERKSSGKSHGTVYVPVFRYTPADGRTMDVVGQDGTNPPAWTVGETSRILYDPADPSHAIADTLGARWGSSLLVACVTLGFIAGGILGLRTRRWRLF